MHHIAGILKKWDFILKWDCNKNWNALIKIFTQWQFYWLGIVREYRWDLVRYDKQ
jgi:hypothetical protein